MKFPTLILYKLLSMQLFASTLSLRALAAEPAAFDTWAKTAKLGGAAVWAGMTAAHKRGLRVVWYYPALEVVTVTYKPETVDITTGSYDWEPWLVSLQRIVMDVF